MKHFISQFAPSGSAPKGSTGTSGGTSDLPGYPEFAHGLDERGLNKGTFAVSPSRGDGGALVGILVRRIFP
jgi:hypothetical protein